MTRRRIKRPRRVWRWTGVVQEVYGLSVAVFTIPVDHDGPELYADIPKHLVPRSERGDILNIYVHKRGKKERWVINHADTGAWTAEELAHIRETAFMYTAALKDLTE